MNVVIIGISKGIGFELARQYHEAGHTVVGTCRQASDALKRLGCEYHENVELLSPSCITRFSEALQFANIDVLIHSAGMLKSDTYETVNAASLREHFEINTIAPLLMIKALEHKLVSGSKVGIISSRVGSIADNSSANNYAYRISKTAVNMLGKCLSIDLAEKGVLLALLHPGYVRTDMTGGNGFIEAEESAAGLIKRIEALSVANSGVFVHSNGEVLPW